MEASVGAGQQVRRAPEHRGPRHGRKSRLACDRVHEREGTSEHGRVRADLDDAGHRVPGIGEGVLQRALSRRALTALGLGEYPDDQPPREGWWHVRQLQCVNFRDAKQYWGLEDFMNVNARPVYNGANLAMFMVNVSQALIHPMRARWSAFSVNDLKAWFRGQKYVIETLKLLPEPPDSIFIDQVVSKMAGGVPAMNG